MKGLFVVGGNVRQNKRLQGYCNDENRFAIYSAMLM